jgi:hypothetical protein
MLCMHKCKLLNSTHLVTATGYSFSMDLSPKDSAHAQKLQKLYCWNPFQDFAKFGVGEHLHIYFIVHYYMKH